MARDAGAFTQQLVGRCSVEVMQNLGAHHHIHAGIGERQLHRVTHQGRVALRPRRAGQQRCALEAKGPHRNTTTMGSAYNRCGDVAKAGAQVEQRAWCGLWRSRPFLEEWPERAQHDQTPTEEEVGQRHVAQ